MSVICVPYHIDERLLALDVPLPPDDTITVDLPDGDVWERIATLYAKVARSVAAEVGAGSCPVVISGDCMTSLGTVTGLQAAGIDPGIIWLDAHGDVQTPETTASGYLGGYPLRLLAGYRPDLITARLGLRPIAEENVVLAGARDLDPPEISYLAGSRIQQRQVAELDPARLPAGPLYVHVDLDVIDSGILPGLRFPAPGGPGPADVAGAVRMLLGTGRVAAVGIGCTWYPGNGAAAIAGPQLVAALGHG